MDPIVGFPCGKVKIQNCVTVSVRYCILRPKICNALCLHTYIFKCRIWFTPCSYALFLLICIDGWVRVLSFHKPASFLLITLLHFERVYQRLTCASLQSIISKYGWCNLSRISLVKKCLNTMLGYSGYCSHCYPWTARPKSPARNHTSFWLRGPLRL